MSNDVRVENLRGAYHELERRVGRALLTQVGDAARLREARDLVLLLIRSMDQVRAIFHLPRHTADAGIQHNSLFDAEEYATIQRSMAVMVDTLDEACHESSDPPDAPGHMAVDRTSTGARGRPKITIDPDFLREALTFSGPTDIARRLHCAPRTVRRRALEAGLSVPRDPIYTDTTNDDGSITRIYTSSRPPISTHISDEQVDALIAGYLEVFPKFGRNMLHGRLRADGYNIPIDRIRQSYARVHGAPNIFGDRSISRKYYSVAGANSLWHHDGQHGRTRALLCLLHSHPHDHCLGLIRFKLVIHCFIDGKSRFITGLRVNNNNRKRTVLDLFLDAVSVHGVPSRVRGDFGTENEDVAQWMEDNRGPNRGSYIWGRWVCEIA